MSLYTKAGDKGKSVVSNKRPLSKDSLIFDVLGFLDELSCTLGFLQQTKISEISKVTVSIQEDLLVIGSVISNVKKAHFPDGYWNKKVKAFEKIIDELSSRLPKLDSFILPGGCSDSSYLHLARATCRKTERIFVRYWRNSNRKDLADIAIYLNRLSDLLFAFARFSNKKHKVKELTWKGSK